MNELSSMLLVDADALTLDILGDEGYSIEAVRTRHEAITKVKQKPYGAVLVNVGVQEKKVLPILHSLTRLDPNLPMVILLTPLQSKGSTEWIKLGTFDLLKKPFNSNEVKKTLQRVLNMQLLRKIAQNTVNGLQSSAERYRSIVETARDAILLGDLDGNILSWNNAAEHMFGYPAEEIVSKPLALLMSPSSCAQYTNVLEQAHSIHARREIDSMVELVGLKKDGVEFPIELSLSHSRSGTSHGNFICVIIRDITDRKKMDAQLSEEAKLADVTRRLGDIAHDIKNMLMPILNGAKLLEEELHDHFHDFPNMNSRQVEATKKFSREALGMVISNTRRMQDRVREIADTVKGKTSRPYFATCQISGLANGVIESLRLYSGEKGISLHTQELESLPPIHADEKRLFNALYNLVNNAIPETPSGGMVTIAGRVGPDQTTVMISVTDTGNGMTPEIRDSLFTSETISQKIGGTGLGTKIIKDVVDAHGGSITVESERGNGTTFTMELPVNAR